MTSGLQVDKPKAAIAASIPNPAVVSDSAPEEIPVDEKQVAIVYNPKMENRTGCIIFVCPKYPDIKVGDAQMFTTSLETDRLVLHPGSQLISEQLWEKMKAHPPSGKEIARMQRTGVVRVMRSAPQGNFQTKTTLDFELDDGLEIVGNSLNTEWLRLCIAKDNRSRIYNACVKRLEEVDAMKRGTNLGVE